MLQAGIMVMAFAKIKACRRQSEDQEPEWKINSAGVRDKSSASI
jgi:hypothetical protein